MDCENVVEMMDEKENISLLDRIFCNLHLIFCPDCAEEVRRLELCRDIFLNDFLPLSPELEDTVMAAIATEEIEEPELLETGGFSIKGWIIAGIVMLVSLASVFFGMEFNKIALAAGMSFMIPVGITIGIVLSSYGALFIGSHLKELAERFGL